MTPEAKEHLDKARQCLNRAQTILAAGVGEDSGRDTEVPLDRAAAAIDLAEQFVDRVAELLTQQREKLRKISFAVVSGS